MLLYYSHRCQQVKSFCLRRLTERWKKFKISVTYIFDFESLIISINLYHSFFENLELSRSRRKEQNAEVRFENLLTIIKLLTGTLTEKLEPMSNWKVWIRKTIWISFRNFSTNEIPTQGIKMNVTLYVFFLKLQDVNWYLEERTQALFHWRISVLIRRSDIFTTFSDSCGPSRIQREKKLILQLNFSLVSTR